MVNTQSEKLFSGPCDFVLGAAALSQIPDDRLPEVAFIGRSNVGKSSLINALTNRKGLARTSNTPGRTRQLNFFNLGGKLMLVDLPGYGYAKASKSEVAEWNQLIRDYLRGRAPLRRVCVLIDSRHGIKPNDVELMAMLDEAAVPYQLVLTKSDKKQTLAPEQAGIDAIRDNHPALHPEVLLTSSEKGIGIAALREALYSLI
jgi:GTP-binding protein